MLECSAHNKTSLVTSVYNMFLLLFTSAGSHTYGHECAIYTVQCYLESSLKKSQTKHVGKINKKLQHQVVFLCAAHWSPLKKDTESINLVYFRSVEEEFRSRTRSRPPMIRDDTLHLCHAHSRIDGLFIACGVCFLLVGANVM